MKRKVSNASDIHLEMADVVLPGGDILALAGDVFVAAVIRLGYGEAYERFVRFVKEEFSKYKDVMIVMGNHDHYHGVLEDTAKIIKDFLAEHAPNARLLDNESVIIDGTMFIGSTMWANYCYDTPYEYHIQQSMNDFRLIHTRKHAKAGCTRNVLPEDLHEEHQKSVAFLKEQIALAKETTDRPCVVITHHVPTERSKGTLGRAHGSSVTSDGYYAHLDDLIEDNPHIGYWISGHTHDPVDYKIGPTRMISNPRGYDNRWHGEAIAKRFNSQACDFYLESEKVAVPA